MGTLQFYISANKCKNTHHRFLNVSEVWIPSNAHYHLVYWTIIQFGPAIIYSSINLFWQIIHYFIWEICCKEFIILNP
jgi:hypothetical protein